MIEEPKACPLCDGEADLHTTRNVTADNGVHQISCLSCGLNIDRGFLNGNYSTSDEKEMLNEVVSAWNTRANEWIPVSERLPDIDVYVLVAAPSGYRGTAYRLSEAEYNPDYKGWVDVSNTRITDYGNEVTHWKPLPPAPPKELKGNG